MKLFSRPRWYVYVQKGKKVTHMFVLPRKGGVFNIGKAKVIIRKNKP